VRVESNQLFAHLSDHGDLLSEEFVEVRDVALNVAARLVYLVEQGHLLLDEVDHVVDVPAVPSYQLLLLLEDLLDQLLVLRAKLVRVACVLNLKGLDSGDRVVQIHRLVVVLRRYLLLVLLNLRGRLGFNGGLRPL